MGLSDCLPLAGRILVVLHDAQTCRCSADFLSPVCQETGRYQSDNYLPKAGRISIARRMVNDTTTGGMWTGADPVHAGKINAVAVGTGAFSTNWDRNIMANELNRVAAAASFFSDQVATVKGFFNSSQAIGTLTEAALFGDLASPPGAVGTGTIYTHAQLNVTKSSNETMTVFWTITVGV